ncbi:ATP-binding cassette sub-family A member 13-like [Aotus nancymaae]|uniref:ATP-binding cassette sub-family A member 13-like n=1 Tax=Aotus nancymaae TaxID=37293 RepID=UPI0030FECD9F
MDLNKTEEVILKLESLHQQPHIWDFLLITDEATHKPRSRGRRHACCSALSPGCFELSENEKQPGYHLSMQNIVWDPQKVQYDLKSQFGFDDLHAEQILNYSAELKEIPTDSSLEKMVCSVLSSTLEDEAERWGHTGDCHPKWSEAKNYLVHAVSWL